MTLEQQVVSLGLAKKLKELGVKQESYAYWIADDQMKPHVVVSDDPIYEWEEDSEFASKVPTAFSVAEELSAGDSNITDDIEVYSSFTVAELGEILPSNFETTKRGDGKWLAYDANAADNINHQELANTEADARAKMLVYLVENNLIQLQ